MASVRHRAHLLAELMVSLDEAVLPEMPVEILTLVDGGEAHTGTKRNRLARMAQGRYVSFVDDDDQVYPGYASAILEAIAREPGADVVIIRGERTVPDGVNGRPLRTRAYEFDYRIGADGSENIDGVFWRHPDHLCPVRREIVLSHPYRDISVDEDVFWARDAAPSVRTSVRACARPVLLYHYRYNPAKSAPGFS